MPNYLSKPTALPTRVNEIDEDSLGRIMMFRQQTHDQNVLQTQNKLDSYRSSALELVRESDREYMQSKISEFAEQVSNQYGESNFGELSTMSGINALSSVITKDDRVIGAIKDSRMIGDLLNNYNKLKSDPKLMDRYSKTNEDWDMQFVHRYMNDPNSRYNGPRTPTPFVDVDKKLSEGLAKLKADVETRLGPEGYINYIKGVGPEKIRSMVMNKLATNPQLATQIGINQWSKFKNLNDSQVLSQFNTFRAEKDQRLKSQQDALQLRLSSLPPDSKEVKALQDQIDFLKGKRKEYAQMKPDANGAKNYLYMTELVDGYTAQFSYQEQQMKSDPTAIARWNLSERQRQFNWTASFKMTEFDANQFWKQQNFGLAQEKLGLQKQALEFKMSGGASGSKKGDSTNPLYVGQDETLQAMPTLTDIEGELSNLQTQNKQALATGVLELITYNNPAFRSQYDSIKRNFIGNETTSALGVYNKITGATDEQLRNAGISLELKKELLARSNAMFRQLDAVAMGAAPASSLRNMNNSIMSGVVQTLNHNFAGAKSIMEQLSKAQDRAYLDLGIPRERIQQANQLLKQYKSNPSTIPTNTLLDAAMDLGYVSKETATYGQSGQALGFALRNPKMRNAINQRAIEITQQGLLGKTPSQVREAMGKHIEGIGMSRKSYAFPSKLEKDTEIMVTNQITKLAPDMRSELENKTVRPANFTQLNDGSYRLKYQLEGTGDEKGKLSEMREVIIPANQAESIEQFLPKSWGTQMKYPHYQRALSSEKGGLYTGDGSVMGLYSEGNFNIPYSLQRYDMGNPNDGRVKVIVNKAVGAGSRWVDAPGLIFPNADSAIEGMNQLGKEAYNGGHRNVQNFINILLKQNGIK